MSPAFPPAGYGGLGRGPLGGDPQPVPPARAPQGGPPLRPRPSESWPRTRPLCLGSRRVCGAHRTRKITESLDPPPPSPASASPPWAPVHHFPKDPFVRLQSPRSTRGCPPIHHHPPAPRSGWMASQLNGHEFEQTLGDGEGQGSLVCCSPWDRKELDND